MAFFVNALRCFNPIENWKREKRRNGDMEIELSKKMRFVADYNSYV